MPNDLLDTLNDISTSLATLALQIRAEALAGLGSRNKVAEHVLLPVLRRLYSASGLANTNTLAANFPGIDLYDPSSGLGVQVTSDSTAAKITKTIETLAIGTLPIKQLVIALATDATPRFKATTRAKWKEATQGRFDFEPETDILAFDRLLARIQLLPPPEVAAVAAELRALVLGSGMPLVSQFDEASLPYRRLAPARESFVSRREYGATLAALLGEGGRESAATVGLTTALQGAGGFGKTALAIELCYDERIRERYPDGILWVQMRDNLEDGGRLKEIGDVLRWWTREEPPAFETVAKAGQHLISLLEGKRVLLVVDDVWHSADLAPFRGLSPAAALLATTRDSRTLPREAVAVPVDAMEIPEAVRLLGAGLPGGAESDLKPLASLLGEWPLLLKLVNRQVESWIRKGLGLHEAIRRAENALNAKGLTYFDPKDAKDRSQAAALTLEVSVERLPREDQERYAELAIFPEDANIPLSVLEKLWQLDSFDVEELASRCFDVSLLRSLDLRAGTIRLHDVIHAYLLKRGQDHLPKWNRRLLDAGRPENGRWSDLPQEENYLWNHLFHFLTGAGQSDVCRNLLFDFQYLHSKLAAAGVNALLADYSSFVEKDEELRLVRDALRLSAHVLMKDRAALPGQLQGRLLDRREARIRALLQAREGSETPWLRPRMASLTLPGGPLIRTIDHPGEPKALAVFSDGRIVAGSSDGRLRVWEAESGQCVQVFNGHSSEVNSVAVLGSQRLISGSRDSTLRVWDVESGQTIQILQGHSDEVLAVAVLDSQRVISGCRDGTLRVWDVESGQVLQFFETLSMVLSVAVLDDRHVVSGCFDGTLRIWDVESGQALKTFGDSSGVLAVAVSGCRRVVAGIHDGTLRVWDVKTGHALQVLRGASSGVLAVAVLDNRRVVSNCFDGKLRVWDVESGQILKILGEATFRPLNLAVLDSRRVVSGYSDGTLRVWDVESGQTLQDPNRHSAGVEAVAELDGRRVVSGSRDGTLRVWDVEEGQVLQILQGHDSWVLDVAVLDSRHVISASRDATMRVWDTESGLALQVITGYTSWVNAVAVFDSRRVIDSSADMLRVWDLERGQPVKISKGYASWDRAVAVLDNRRVVSGADDGTLRVWNVESGRILQILKGHSERILALAVLDSRRVVSGSRDGMLRVWDVEREQILKVLKGHSNGVQAVAVLDGRRVVSGSDDCTLRVWNAESGQVESSFTLEAPVTAVATLSDYRVIVAGDATGRVHFFDFVEPHLLPKASR